MKLVIRPLSSEAFAPFGEVIDHPRDTASDAAVVRHNALATVDLDTDGIAIMSLMSVRRPVVLPYSVPFLERHPFGSQAFLPLGNARFIVIACSGTEKPDLDTVQAFLTDGRQGVNIGRGTWHGPLASMDPATFAVVDRQGPGDNGEVFRGFDLMVAEED